MYVSSACLSVPGGGIQSHQFLALSVTGGNIKWRKRERGKMYNKRKEKEKKRKKWAVQG
jgi:hypothetical protein